MRSKKKGFTVLELIIALSITVLVLGIVYSFFLSNTKTINEAQINMELQDQAEDSISKISKKAMEATGLLGVISRDGSPVNGQTSISVSNITFGTLQGNCHVYYELTNHILTENIENPNGTVTQNQIGENVDSISVSSLDNTIPLDDTVRCKGIKITITISKNHSGRAYTYTVSSNINFRNHS